MHDALIEQIRQAFADVEYPGDEDLTVQQALEHYWLPRDAEERSP